MKKEYTIYKTNKFDDSLLHNLVARFHDLKMAEDFVNRQSLLGESFVIQCDGKTIDML